MHLFVVFLTIIPDDAEVQFFLPVQLIRHNVLIIHKTCLQNVKLIKEGTESDRLLKRGLSATLSKLKTKFETKGNKCLSTTSFRT